MAPPLNFSVHVNEPELVRPVKPTPKEFKYLSNIDDQSGLRNHMPFVHLYPPCATVGAPVLDPIMMIKHSLAKVLAFYYPVAGRLRNADKGKLVVDCCGQGVIFRGANADITLAQLCKNGGLKPPFPQWDKLLVDDVWGGNLITNSPLLRVQVTRLACGGFILAYTFNHCICDAYGAYQFITAVSEFCKNPNRKTPSTLPAWGRETLRPRSPPIISYPHHEYDDNLENPTISYSVSDFKSLAQTSVFLSRADILALKTHINGNEKCPTFDAIASCLWRARTRTLISPESSTRLIFPIDTRFRYKSSLPNGYYGSVLVFPCTVIKAAKLVDEPLRCTAKLIREVKKDAIGDEYRASVLDLIEANGRRGFCSEGAFLVSDMSRLRFVDVDFGWGGGVYGGMARAGIGMVPGMVTPVIAHKNEEGVEGVLALVSLPPALLERFHKEVRNEIDSVAPCKPISAL